MIICLYLTGVIVATVIFAMLGKFLVEINFEMVYVVTSEMYPTMVSPHKLQMLSYAVIISNNNYLTGTCHRNRSRIRIRTRRWRHLSLYCTRCKLLSPPASY